MQPGVVLAEQQAVTSNSLMHVAACMLYSAQQHDAADFANAQAACQLIDTCMVATVPSWLGLQQIACHITKFVFTWLWQRTLKHRWVER